MTLCGEASTLSRCLLYHGEAFLPPLYIITLNATSLCVYIELYNMYMRATAHLWLTMRRIS